MLALQYIHFPDKKLVFQIVSITSLDNTQPLSNIIKELDENDAFQNIINCFKEINNIVHRTIGGLCSVNANELRNGLFEETWIKESKLGIINDWMPENTTIEELKSRGNYGCGYHAFCIVKTVNDLYLAIEVTPKTVGNACIPCIQILGHTDFNEFLNLLAMRYCYQAIYFVSRTDNKKEKIDLYYPKQESWRPPEYHVEKFVSKDIPMMTHQSLPPLIRQDNTQISVVAAQFSALLEITEHQTSSNDNNNKSGLLMYGSS
jgi:hypothetical protein